MSLIAPFPPLHQTHRLGPHPPRAPNALTDRPTAPAPCLWRFGDDALTALFATNANSVIELAASAPGHEAATSGLALALLASRSPTPGALVWIDTHTARLEHGGVSARGLAAWGLDPGRVMVVRAKDDRQALWAVEEAVMSGAAAGVVTQLAEADFTATRRLALRAHGTPALLMLPHTRQGSTAAQARWRIASAPSSPTPDTPRTPGATRWRAVLERSRSPAFPGTPQSFLLEWSRETNTHNAAGEAVRLRVVPQLATAAPGPHPPQKPSDAWPRSGPQNGSRQPHPRIATG